ncbi:MAG: NAD(P)/FAD-dependent oxidoreductase [Paracoccaceae bacterium]|nr:MAG: NAD(P)/FAD-dependent oxidoreductase [Paracoccaceae bacterium]
MTRVVVIGAGQAAAALAARLRSLGHAGPITLIGDEPSPPYQRPPLSKAFLMGEIAEDRLYLRPLEFYAQADILLRTGTRATAIDRVARVVDTTGGPVPYDVLVLATGAVPRRLAGAIGGELPGVFTLRGIADVEAMRPAFRRGARLLVVGGGYIGLEAAAVARKLGLEVTLIELADRILKRVAAPETSAWFRDLHRGHGVTIMEGQGLARLRGADRVRGAILPDGRDIAADLVIAGVGVTPATDLAEAAGLRISNGIATDALGRTSEPDIWAAGDCASFPGPDGRLRLESVQNAIDMAEAVAANIMGAAQPYEPKPWFWSDQYDVKLQIAGLNTGYTDVAVRNSGDGRSHWYFAGDRLISVDAMNDARAYMVGKRLIETGISPAPALLSDPATDLKALLKA